MSEIKKLGNAANSNQRNAVYDSNGVSPTIQAAAGAGGGQMPMSIEIKVLGQMDNTHDHTFESANRVYGPEGVAPTIPTSCGGGHLPKIMNVSVVAMRGRDATNPNHRGPTNENYEQRLEERADGCTNTITTVQKDNLVLIKQATKDGYIPCELGGVADLNYPNGQTRRGRVINQGNVSPTLTTENIPSVLEKWIWEIDGIKYLIRIRKLTPKECWRLMGFSDEDFEKAEKVNSNTQLYKQAGNSIVKDVLMNVFLQLVKGDK